MKGSVQKKEITLEILAEMLHAGFALIAKMTKFRVKEVLSKVK